MASRWLRFFLFFGLVCVLFSFTDIGPVDGILRERNPLVYKYPPTQAREE